MAYVCERPEYTVTVKAGFISEWQWAVHASVSYRRGEGIRARRHVETEARAELMAGIARESRRGRESGAGTVLVLVEGDREIAGIFSGLDESYRPMWVA